jgi:signal transduction histidine kinase
MAETRDVSNGASPITSGSPNPRSSRLFGAVGMLRLLLLATILIPLGLGAVAAYLSYRANYEHATASASEAVAVAAENTAKVLDTHLLVAARIDDLLGTMTDDQIRAMEKPLHDKVAKQIAGLPQVAAAWVIGAGGRELLSAHVYPVNGSLDQSSREDFRAFQNSDLQTYIWMLRARSLDTGEYQPYFTVSLRRTGSDGRFNGIVVIAVSGSYFASFYDSLLGGSERYTASVLKDDGTVLAQFPEAPGDAPAQPLPDPLLARAIANEAQSGIAESGAPFDGAGRIVAVRRVANYPVYVTIEQTRASVLAGWLRSIVGYVVIGVPAAIALFALSLVALRRTRREQVAQAQVNEAMARRATLEVQLHRAQRLEAVGLLTAGIAHDFNNLMTVVFGNIERLEGTIDEADSKRQKFLLAAKDGCARASALTMRLLGFARREPSNPRPIDVNEVVADTFQMARQSGDRVATEFRLDKQLWLASVDPDELATALLNLAFNARDAMPEGGKLTVETTNFALDELGAAEVARVPAGDYVGISVEDTGRGMPEEVREKAFDPFFTTKSPGKGTGLGLSLVNAFATRSGGYCRIESAPGRGTTIRIYLPRHRAARATDRPGAETAEASAGSRQVRQDAGIGGDRVEPQ